MSYKLVALLWFSTPPQLQPAPFGQKIPQQSSPTNINSPGIVTRPQLPQATPIQEPKQEPNTSLDNVFSNGQNQTCSPVQPFVSPNGNMIGGLAQNQFFSPTSRFHVILSVLRKISGLPNQLQNSVNSAQNQHSNMMPTVWSDFNNLRK